MAFPTTSWKHLQPSCMEVQYHTSPQDLSTNKNTLDAQCYTSPPQDSLSTNDNPLDYISNRLLEDYEQLHNTMPIEGYSTLEWIALEAQNQVMNSNNIETSNIDWLNIQASNYEYKDAQEPLINSSSTISSTTLSPHIDQFSNYSFGNQSLASYNFNDSPLNLLHNKPLEIEPKSLDLQLIEQELAMYNHNVGASPQFNNEELMSNLKCLAQGDHQMNTSSLLICDGAPSLMKPKSMHPHVFAEIMNAPSSICRTKEDLVSNAEEDLVSNAEERDNTVVKREEIENGDHAALSICNMFGYSSMMLNSNTPLQLGGLRRETKKKSCREEGEERETSRAGKRESKYIIGADERETRGEKNYIGDEREAAGGERYNGSLLEVKRENVSRKRGRENYVCKRRTAAAGGSEEEEEVILVRARRGQATDSHSLAERVRRERISQRMKLLQDLVPSCTKVLGKAAVLEEIINYVKSLQQQIEFLSMRLATTDYQKKRFQM